MSAPTPYGGTVPPATSTPTTEAQVTVPTTTPAADTGFAFTGGDVIGFGVIGGAAVVFGVVLLALRRWADRNRPNLYVEGYRP